MNPSLIVFFIIFISILYTVFRVRSLIRRMGKGGMPGELGQIVESLQRISEMNGDVNVSVMEMGDTVNAQGKTVSVPDLHRKVTGAGIAVELKDLFLHQKNGGSPERTLQGLLDFHANGTPLSWAEASALDLSDPGGSTPLLKLI